MSQSPPSQQARRSRGRGCGRSRSRVACLFRLRVEKSGSDEMGMEIYYRTVTHKSAIVTRGRTGRKDPN